jgi:diguanylate cyclase (GGDEF)-like protein
MLRSTVRGHDVAPRYGGEEFVVLLLCTDADQAIEVAQWLRAAIAGHDWLHRPVTVSCGVATYRPDTPDAVALVDCADRALYRSRESGRNRTSRYDQRLYTRWGTR